MNSSLNKQIKCSSYLKVLTASKQKVIINQSEQLKIYNCMDNKQALLLNRKIWLLILSHQQSLFSVLGVHLPETNNP